jgi:hypothetical protein
MPLFALKLFREESQGVLTARDMPVPDSARKGIIVRFFEEEGRRVD